MFDESSLREKLRAKMEELGETFRVYGDPAYAMDDLLITPYRNAQDPDQIAFNEAMSSARVSVEHFFGLVTQQFAFTSMKKQMKIGLQPVGLYYIVSTILTNFRTCLYRNQISEAFGVDPPSIEDYLATVV